MKRLVVALLSLACFSLFASDDLERRVAAMAKIGFAGSPSFSPDGKRIAFLSNLSGSPQVWVVPATGGWPDQVTAFDDPVGAVEWSPNGEWLAVQVAPGGGLNEQIVVVRPDGTGMKMLTDGGKTNNRLGRWTPDSKSILFGSNRRTAGAIDVWLADVATGEKRLVAESKGIASIGQISADGKFVLVTRLASRGDNDVYRVALDGSGEVHLTPHKPPATFTGAAFGPTPDEVFLAGNPDRDLHAFGRVRISGGKASPFEVLSDRPDAELSGFVMNDAGTQAVLFWNVAGKSEMWTIDPATKDRKVLPLPSGIDIVGGAEFSDDGTKLAVVFSGSGAPSDIWTIDFSTSTRRQVTRSPHPGVNLADLVKPELLRYKAHDGLELSGWLYRPRDGKPPYATVLSFHGGPEAQERPFLNGTYQALLANGIAVFAPNVRGSSGFGKKFVNLDNGKLRADGIRDIKATADFLTSQGIADAKRLGITGGSYGGYMVMAGVTEYPDLFAAGANLFGIVNFETFFKHTEPWMAAISTREYGDPATEAAMLRSLSPIHKLDRVKTPLLVLHGANDTNVPVVEAEQVVETLKKRGVPVEYVLFPDEGHGWRKTPNRIRSAVEITKFFVKYLKPAA
ncbi:MAG TPA: S9 family peptidase [Thermoanaerobaculia bacterium]|nr:S9 family peptidase [Thermoanaerobaculia bacterium]